ncbi:hypothetical protein HK405_012453, partial [Cladochytrium tenue]
RSLFLPRPPTSRTDYVPSVSSAGWRSAVSFGSNDPAARTTWGAFLALLLRSTPARFLITALSTLWIKVTATAVIFLVLCIAHLCLIYAVFGVELESLEVYNLVHIFLAFISKAIVASGLLLSRLTSKALVASALARSSRGVPLVDVATRYGSYAPRRGRGTRRLLIFTLAAIEALTWLLHVQMQWVPVTSTVQGIFPCTPASYPSKPPLVDSLLPYLAGDVEYAAINSYAMPLVDGVVGGWSSWPLADPSAAFSVEGTGVVYLISSRCSEPEPLGNFSSATSATGSTGAAGQARQPNTWLRVAATRSWQAVSHLEFDVAYAADAHDSAVFAGVDIVQHCLVELLTGPGSVQFSFVADEWQMVSGGRIVQIQLPDPAAVLRNAGVDPAALGLPYLDPPVLSVQTAAAIDGYGDGSGDSNSSALYAGSVRERIAPLAAEFANLTSWIAEQVVYTLTGDGRYTAPAARNESAAAAAVYSHPPFVPCAGTRATSRCTVMRWAAGPATTGHSSTASPALTHRAVAALVAQVAHYVTNQFDPAAAGSCTYFGDAGHGRAAAPAWPRALVALAATAAAICAANLLATFWFVAAGSSASTAAAANLLDDPLLLAYHARTAVPTLLAPAAAAAAAAAAADGESTPSPQETWRAATTALASVRVRFGEPRAARGESVRTLVLDSPAAVVNMRKVARTVTT